jgi:acyl-CoA thioesterase FadM
MARVKIDLPTAWLYEIDLPVRITDINYGQHLGNDAFLAMIQEARVRWLHRFGWTELRILDGVGLIMVDLAIRFKHESVFGDTLTVRLAATEWTDVGFELTYQAVKQDGGAEVARAQSGLVFFDYRARKLARVPAGFRERVEAGA